MAAPLRAGVPGAPVEADGLFQPCLRSHMVSPPLQSQAYPPSGEGTEPQLWVRGMARSRRNKACEVDEIVAVLENIRLSHLVILMCLLIFQIYY